MSPRVQPTMTGGPTNRQRDAHDSVPTVVPAASGRRLASQIGRAFRGTFGAKTGLRTLMQSIAEKMLADGVTAQGVAQAFEACVMQHPARTGCDSPSLISGKPPSAVLVGLATECVAAASLQAQRAIEPFTPSSQISRRGGIMHRTKDPVVLIVDPDEAARAELHSLLERSGYTVVATSAADAAVAIMDGARVSLVVTEMYLASGKALCLLPMIAGSVSRRRAKVLAYTQHGHAKDRRWAAAHGASGYVLKRNGSARLLDVVGRLAPRG